MINCIPLQWNLSKNIPPFDNGVFTSCAKNGLCFHRNHFSNNYIDVIKKDGTELIQWTQGEDPRVFEKDNKVYLITNYFNDMKLLELNETNILHKWKLPFSGKNVMPINAFRKSFQFLDIQNEKLYDVQLFKQHVAIKKTISLDIILRRNPYCTTKLQNCVFRGGSSGISYCNGIIGAGHCTACPKSKVNTNMMTRKDCLHKPFLWYKTPAHTNKLHIFSLCLSNKNIIDPTTIFQKKLLTSESDNWWFTSNQKFRNREYHSVMNDK